MRRLWDVAGLRGGAVCTGRRKKPSKTNLQIVSVVGLMPRRSAKIKMQDPTCNNYDSYEVIAEF